MHHPPPLSKEASLSGNNIQASRIQTNQALLLADWPIFPPLLLPDRLMEEKGFPLFRRSLRWTKYHRYLLRNVYWVLIVVVLGVSLTLNKIATTNRYQKQVTNWEVQLRKLPPPLLQQSSIAWKFSHRFTINQLEMLSRYHSTTVQVYQRNSIDRNKIIYLKVQITQSVLADKIQQVLPPRQLQECLNNHR